MTDNNILDQAVREVTNARNLPLCSKCGKGHFRDGQRYCHKCHAASERERRKNHQMTEGQKLKDRARSYAGTYKRRGKLVQEPCEACGSEHSEMHHEDYHKPLDIHWLCRACHLEHHRNESASLTVVKRETNGNIGQQS